MDNKELERIQMVLLAEEDLPEEETLSTQEETVLEELLAGEELPDGEDISLEELLAEVDQEELEQDAAADELSEENQEENAEELSLDEILEDGELNELLAEEDQQEQPGEEPEPAFEDPDKIHDPKEPLVYQNFATEAEAKEKEAAAQIKERDEKTVIGLMILASVLSLGIIGILGYWLSILL